MRRAGSASGRTRRVRACRILLPRVLSSVLLYGFAGGVAAETHVLRLGTGPKGGAYSALGEGLKRVLEQRGSGLAIRLVPSKSSVESIGKLVAGECDFAFVRNDVAAAAYKGTLPFDKGYSGLRGLASLYTETVQIVVREAAWIRQLSDLKGERVAVGPKGSGSEANAAAILKAAGISYGDLAEVVYASLNDVEDGLAAGTIDAVFMTAGVPTPAARTLQNVCLVAIPPKILMRLREEHSTYVGQRLPVGTYPWQSEEVATVGLRALLLTRSDLSRRDALTIAAAVFCCTDTLSHFHPIAEQINRMRGMQGMPLPLHRGAAHYYRRRRLFDIAAFAGVFSLVVCGLGFLRYRRRRLLRAARNARRETCFEVTVVLAGILAGLVGLMWLVEGPHNEDFARLGSTLRSLILYMMSGMEHFAPSTVAGKVIACLMVVIVLGMTGGLAGLIASRLIHRKEEPVAPEPPAYRHDVFLSYRREDGAATARAFQARLSADGYNVFLDVDDLKTGKFDDALLRHIEGARNVLLILSVGSLDLCRREDDWLRKEIAHAIARGKNIVPIMMPGFAFPVAATLPEEIREIPLHNCVEYSHTFFDAMMDRVKEFLAADGDG